jgi:hypothetical protein
MNLYIRYFDDECVVKSVDEALNFISNIQGFNMTPQFVDDFRQYAEGTMPYPKRYKVRTHVYFIIIKTEAASMLDFKEKRALRSGNGSERGERQQSTVMLKLNEQLDGWYEGTMDFKRVQMVPGTGKFQYRDTHFVAQVKAHSGMDCYNRIVEHLRQRVDDRSQFPSAKGKNFKFVYLGAAK